jgi:hypothetical protein
VRRLRESWSEVVIVGLAEAAIGLIATKIYGDAASNEYLHDIGLIIILTLPHFSGHLDCGERVAQKGVQDGYEIPGRVPTAGGGVSAAA